MINFILLKDHSLDAEEIGEVKTIRTISYAHGYTFRSLYAFFEISRTFLRSSHKSRRNLLVCFPVLLQRIQVANQQWILSSQ